MFSIPIFLIVINRKCNYKIAYLNPNRINYFIITFFVLFKLSNNLGSKANGTFAVLTGTTHTAAGQQTSQNYPSGFNQNNCAIAGVMVKLGQNWYLGNYNSGYTYINAQVILSSQVGIIPASGWTNCQYKIVLYKYA